MIPTWMETRPETKLVIEANPQTLLITIISKMGRDNETLYTLFWQYAGRESKYIDEHWGKQPWSQASSNMKAIKGK